MNKTNTFFKKQNQFQKKYLLINICIMSFLDTVLLYTALGNHNDFHQLGIFIFKGGSLIAAAFTSAVMSTPSGALQHSINEPVSI